MKTSRVCWVPHREEVKLGFCELVSLFGCVVVMTLAQIKPGVTPSAKVCGGEGNPVRVFGASARSPREAGKEILRNK